MAIPSVAQQSRWRRDFPIFATPLPKGLPLTYLDSASSAQKPATVIAKELEVYQEYYANAGFRGVYRFGARVDAELESARGKVQSLLGAEHPEEVVFTSGTTMSLNLVAYAWARRQLRPGDEVLLNELEHHANFVPWQQIALETGARCRMIPLTEDLQLDLNRLPEVLSERTRIVAVTGMSNVTGTRPPIAELAARAHAVGALICVDGAQSVPHSPVDVRQWDVDFLAFSGHKIYGPSGVGVLYGKRSLLDSMAPFLYGGHMISEVSVERSTWAPVPARFEAGTAPIAQAIALGAAVDYLQSLGGEAVEHHERALLDYAHQQLEGVPGLRIYGPPPAAKGGIVSFTIEGAAAEDLAQLLDRRGVFVRHGHHCTMPLHQRLGVAATVRASFGVYNNSEDVDRLCEALEFARDRLRLNG